MTSRLTETVADSLDPAALADPEGNEFCVLRSLAPGEFELSRRSRLFTADVGA